MRKAVIAGASVATAALLITTIGVVVYQSTAVFSSVESPPRRPNVIIFLADDTGYADLQSFGNPIQELGAIDQMVQEGMKFTQWSAAERICTPSRASLLTGRYPVRTAVYGDHMVFNQDSSGGLPRSEVTMAEALKHVGYSTGMVGKWHLGINEMNNTDGNHLPIHHGFDYVGLNLPLSQHWKCELGLSPEEMSPYCFLYDNTEIVEQPINLNTLTRRLVRDSKIFINKNKDVPFFFYFSFPQTHEAMFCDEEFCGQSMRGSYGDNVNEMAWAVGEVLDELKKLGIEQNTLALFLSDHGPSAMTCRNEGAAGLFRGGKGETWEGGFRVPAVAWWPGTIPAGSLSRNFVNSMDVFPTVLHLAGYDNFAESQNITIDGQLIPEIIGKESEQQGRNSLIYYCSDRILAVRYNQYKIHYFTLGTSENEIGNPDTEELCHHVIADMVARYGCYGPNVIPWDPPLVFDILTDPGEKLMLNTSSGEIQAVLLKAQTLIEEHEKSLIHVPSEVDKPTRPELVPCCNPPSCICNYNG